MAFDGLDVLGIGASLSDEERLVQSSVRKYVESEIVPIIPACFEEGRFPAHLIPSLAELGVLGANLPTEYGCAGMNNVAYGLVMQELEAGDSGVRSLASVQRALCMYPIYTFGSEQQRQRYLPGMAEGKIIGCFGLTEPNFGSNPAGMMTRVKRAKDGFILNGSKAWITNGNIADIAVVWAKDEDDGGTIRGFIVEAGTEGFKAKETKHKLS